MSSILTTGRVSFFFIYSHLLMLYWHRWGEGGGGGGVYIFKKISVKFLTSGKKYMLKMSNIRVQENSPPWAAFCRQMSLTLVRPEKRCKKVHF